MTDEIVSRETRSRFSRTANRAFALLALFILAAGVSGCNKLRARDLLNKGVAAFKEAQFDKAVEAFRHNGFLLLVDDRQLVGLDEKVHLRGGSEVTFLRLIPLVGG